MIKHGTALAKRRNEFVMLSNKVLWRIGVMLRDLDIEQL